MLGHKAVLIPSIEALGDLSFGKMPGFSPALKRGLPPCTLSVDTRGTDMEKYKSWHVVWHCGSQKLPCVASDGKVAE